MLLVLVFASLARADSIEIDEADPDIRELSDSDQVSLSQAASCT